MSGNHGSSAEVEMQTRLDAMLGRFGELVDNLSHQQNQLTNMMDRCVGQNPPSEQPSTGAKGEGPTPKLMRFEMYLDRMERTLSKLGDVTTRFESHL